MMPCDPCHSGILSCPVRAWVQVCGSISPGLPEHSYYWAAQECQCPSLLIQWRDALWAVPGNISGWWIFLSFRALVVSLLTWAKSWNTFLSIVWKLAWRCAEMSQLCLRQSLSKWRRVCSFWRKLCHHLWPTRPTSHVSLNTRETPYDHP